MKCPHCLADLKYRDRRDGKCAKCRRPFALEPRGNVLEMSDLRLRGLAERLSKQGKHQYTAAQLGHAAVRNKIKGETEKQVSVRTQTILIGIMGIVSVALFFFESLRWCSGALFLLIIALGISAATQYLQSRKPPLERFQEVLERFEEQFVAPWEGIHGVLPGRVTAQEMTALRQFQLPPSQVRAVLASPVADVLDCLRANGLPQRLGLALINPDQPAGADEAIIALLRSRPRLPLLLVHDASVPGCLLPALLPARWGLAPNHRIVDLGLRPRHVQQLRLPWKREATPRELLDLLERRAQMPGGLALTPEEREWLRRGYVTSALFIPPARLVTIVTQAVERLAPARIVDPEAQAQAQARAVGFMTWPS